MTKDKILLVDDEEDIRLVLGMALSDMGFGVVTAENGEDGLRRFREERPPIVITDIKMPDIDGIDLLRLVKDQDPDTEVIMITGHGDMDVAIESFQFEAADFITKPINVAALEKSLQRVNEKILTRRKLREYTEGLESLVFKKTTRLEQVERLLDDVRSDDHLRSVQERFRNLFDDLPGYVTVQDSGYRLAEVNKMYRRDFGNEVGELCYKALKGRGEPCPECPVSRTFADGRPCQWDTELTTAGGLRRNVMVLTAPIRNAFGVVTHVLVMYTDISQILDVQNHLSSLGLLIGSISHGIKGLLTGLDGGMYLLDSGLKKDNEEQVQEGMETVKLMVSRIRNMVLDILLYSKERDLKKEPVDVLRFAEDVSEVVAPRVRDRNLVFDCDFAKGLGSFVVDPGYLRTALVNTLENAMEACLADSSGRDSRIVFRALREDEYAVFQVEDNGVGMDQGTLDQMFKLFYSSKGDQGTGLGLYITDKIVRQHGGWIDVASAPGRGTTFTIRIPENYDRAADEVSDSKEI